MEMTQTASPIPLPIEKDATSGEVSLQDDVEQLNETSQPSAARPVHGVKVKRAPKIQGPLVKEYTLIPNPVASRSDLDTHERLPLRA